MSSGYAQLEAAQKEIDGRMREVHSILAQISSDPELLLLTREENPAKKLTNIYQFDQFNKKLQTYTISNQFIENIYIHLRYNDTVFSGNRLFLSLSSAYGVYFQYGGIGLEEWEDLCYRQYYYQTLLNDSAAEPPPSSTYYIQSIPNGAPTSKGVIVISFSKADLLFSLRKITETYGGHAFVLEDGEIIAATEPDALPSEDLSDNLQLAVQSEYSHWTFLLQIPKSSLMKQAVSFRNLGILLLAVSVVLSLIILKSFFGRKAAVVGNILSKLQFRGNSVKTDEFSFIQTSIDRVMLQNTTLEQKIQLYRPQILDEFWRKLLNGQILTFEEAQYYLMQMEEVSLDGPFCVVVLQIQELPGKLDLDGIGSINEMKIFLRQTTARLLTGHIAASDVGVQDVAFISNTTDREELEAVLELVQNDFEKQFRHPLRLGYGRTVESLFHISLSYMDALGHMKPLPSALSSADLGDVIVTPGQMQQLIQAMKSEPYPVVAQYTDSLFRLCFSRPEIPSWSYPQFIHSLLSCVLTAYHDMKLLVAFPEEKLSSSVARVYHTSDFAAQYQVIQEMQEDICSAIHAAKHERSNNTLIEIQAYIEKNLCAYTLSLESVAEHFHLSKAYLSSYFKERSGENFSTYVERMRIEKACVRLSEPNASINDIAEESGYSSAAVFRRAFKRVKGISPSEYIISLRKGGKIP